MFLLFRKVQATQDSDETCGQIGSSPVCIQEATGLELGCLH